MMAEVTLQESDKPVNQLTDQELQAALSAFGCSGIPVTVGTRGILENKLRKYLRAKEEPASSQETKDAPLEEEEQTEKREAPTETVVDSTQNPDGEFYGVVVEGEGTPGHSSLSPFYTNKSDALRAVKSIPGARFKKFSNRASAEAFSSSPASVESRYSSPVIAHTSNKVQSPSVAGQLLSGDVKPNQFPSLQTPALSRFRSVIESGDVTRFSKEVWSNPRYLVNCSRDCPEILHLGCHYNALHCAVRAGQLGICQELISVLQNADFWRLLFPNDSPDTVSQRRTHLVDLFLNMQDKMLGETPLHFASKLGHLEIGRLLLSQPALDQSITNKDDQKAEDIICQKSKSSSEELKDKLRDLIQAPPIYYVPILRAVDNCTPPQLTPPCTITEYHLHQTALSDDRGTPVIGQAIAGPMSPVQAEAFYQEWRSPSSSREWREALQIKRSDPSRGFERVGRQLAETHEIRWREYWAFLGCYCDLRKSEGLQKLEHYLSSSSSLSTPPPPPPLQPLLPPSTSSPPRNLIHNGMVTPSGNVSRELFPCDEDEAEGGSEKKEEREREVMEGVPAIEEGGEGKGGGGEGGGGALRGRGEEEKEKERGEEEEEEGVELESVLEGLSGLTIKEKRDNKEVESKGGGGVDPFIDEKKSQDLERNKEGEGGGQMDHDEEGDKTQSKFDLDSSHLIGEPQLTATPLPSSQKKTSFIMGSEPTKVDHDVYLAVRGAPGLSQYPHILKWISLVQGFSEHTQKGWLTPRSKSKDSPLMDPGSGLETQRSPLLVTSPPQSQLPRPPFLSSSSSVSPPPRRLQTSTLSPRRHFSPLHRSLNAGGTTSGTTVTPSRLHRATPRPRQVLSHSSNSNI